MGSLGFWDHANGGPFQVGRRLAVLTALTGSFIVASLLAAPCEATLSPPGPSITVKPGTSGKLSSTVDLPDVPRFADIEIAIDTTGSMFSGIHTAQTEAKQIVHEVRDAAPFARFAAVQFRDYGDSPFYQVAQPFTASATDIDNAIDSFSAGGGGDAPEAYSLVFHNSYKFNRSPDPGWREDSRKFVIVIGDAQPHGAANDGFSGCDDTSSDYFGLNAREELEGMKGAERTLFMIRTPDSAVSTSVDCYRSLAAAAYPGGAGADLHTDFSTQILNLIGRATGTIRDLHLEVGSVPPGAGASWISFSPKSIGPVEAPSAQTFTTRVHVPPGARPGTYKFGIQALADGADTGHQTLKVVVPPSESGWQYWFWNYGTHCRARLRTPFLAPSQQVATSAEFYCRQPTDVTLRLRLKAVGSGTEPCRPRGLSSSFGRCAIVAQVGCTEGPGCVPRHLSQGLTRFDLPCPKSQKQTDGSYYSDLVFYAPGRPDRAVGQRSKLVNLSGHCVP